LRLSRVFFSGRRAEAFAMIAVRRGQKMVRVHGGLRDDFWQKRRNAFGFVTLPEE
jgi:hypothetical protein